MRETRTDLVLKWVTLGYLAGLVGIALAYHFLSEDLWPLALARYAPQCLFLFPLLPVTFGLLFRRRWSLVLLCSGSLPIVLGYLMGFNLPSAVSAAVVPHQLRIYTHNVHALPKPDAVVTEINTQQPDLVFLQEVAEPQEFWGTRLPQYNWKVNGPFAFGSKLPITSVTEVWSTSYIQYEVILPTGNLTCFNIHPGSIGHVLRHVLGQHVPGSPEVWHQLNASQLLERDIGRRARILKNLAKDAVSTPGYVLVAGDSNVPGGGAFPSRAVLGLTDAFEAAGVGWGYTFPARLPWLRLDQVWLGGGLLAQQTALGNAAGSDHLPVIVDVGY